MKAPWHLWVVGIATLLWNAMGAVDYTMTQMQNEAYLAGFTDAQRVYFQSFPAWVVASWAIAVWFALAGSLLLLLRLGAAVLVFAISAIAMIVTTFQNFVLAEVSMAEIGGPEALWFSVVIFVVAIASWLYARRMRQAGFLR
ncbi:MAG: hypothetical protein KDE08_08780 [Rhodobacteraceae bacterium]|nr:hypothetical protein [Paracoccaceae bacterium]